MARSKIADVFSFKAQKKGMVVMFSNMGRKIRILSQIVMWAGISFSILGGLALALLGKEEQFIVAGIIVAIAGTLVSWILSFLLCGYGELIQANTDMLSAIREMKNDLHIIRVLDETAVKTAANQPQPENQVNRYSPQVAVVNPQIKPEYAAQQEAQMKAQAQNTAMINNNLQQPINKTVYYVETATAAQPQRTAQVHVQKPPVKPSNPEPVMEKPLNVGKVTKVENKVVEISG